jgi:hypothetical protein
MTQWPQYEMVSSPRGKILAMDSAGYVDERNDVSDVLICGSHGAPCATQLVMWARPRGLFIHDAGIGLGDGGVNGLKLLDAYLIPCAAVDGMSARISDGRDMYENGIVSRINQAARRMGLREGMAVSAGAQQLLDNNPVHVPPARRQIKVYSDELGDVFALDTVKYADQRIAGGVLCMGSHAARAMADYVDDLGFRLAGVITNDVGRAKDDSGIEGLALLDPYEVPAATVYGATARVGDARSTYLTGRISCLNDTAAAIGINQDDPATLAARLMLEHAANLKNAKE